MTRETDSDSNRRPAVAGLVGLLVALLVVAAVAAPAAAAPSNVQDGVVLQEDNSTINNSEYYNNESHSRNVSSSDWFDGIGNASIDSFGRMATRFGSFFIGSPGVLDESGTGFQGALITGVVMVAALVGSVATAPVGAVGGSVFAVVIGYGMTAVGLAPQWFRIILLFAIGAVAFVALARILEAR